jgi:hypothetical protein
MAMNTPTRDSEVVFRGVLPSEQLLATVREQDSLLRSVLPVWPELRRTEISRQPAAFRARASGVHDGRELSGQSEHPVAEVAVQRACSELLRALLHAQQPLAA